MLPTAERGGRGRRRWRRQREADWIQNEWSDTGSRRPSGVHLQRLNHSRRRHRVSVPPVTCGGGSAAPRAPPPAAHNVPGQDATPRRRMRRPAGARRPSLPGGVLCRSKAERFSRVGRSFFFAPSPLSLALPTSLGRHRHDRLCLLLPSRLPRDRRSPRVGRRRRGWQREGRWALDRGALRRNGAQLSLILHLN